LETRPLRGLRFQERCAAVFPVWNRDHSDWVAKTKTARLEAGPPRLPQLPIRDFSVEGFAGILGFEFLASHELEVFLVGDFQGQVLAIEFREPGVP